MILVRKQCRLISAFLMLTRLSGLPVLGVGCVDSQVLNASMCSRCRSAQLATSGWASASQVPNWRRSCSMCLTVLGRRLTVTCCEVAVRGGGESRCDRCPSGHRYRLAVGRARSAW